MPSSKRAFNNNSIKDTNQNRLRKLRIEPEIEKKIRVMRYFNMKNNNMINNKMSNTNYSLGNKIQQEEKKLNDLKQKQASDEQFFNTLKTPTEKNSVLTISLVSGVWAKCVK